MTTARTATPSTARAINDRLALDLLLERGPLTASDLRTLTGLSRPTVADLLERLQRSGLVAHAGESAALRRGPNARLYELVGDRAHLAGIDIRSTGVSLVVADLTGRTLGTATIAAPAPTTAPGTGDGGGADAAGAGDGDLLVERTVEALLATAAEAGAGELHTVAVGAPGLVDPATGALNNSGKLPEWHTKLLAALRARPGTEVILENEVNLAGIAEHRIGAAQGRRDFALIWLGHGVGASVVLDGRLRRGASGGTGEIGFLPVPGTAGLPDSTKCDGGFHSMVSSAAICELAARHGLTSEPGTGSGHDCEASGDERGEERGEEHGEWLGEGREPMAEAVVRRAVETGADGFLDELALRIAVGASAICVVLDPGCVVLGGEIGQAGGPELADRVERHLARLSPLATEVRAGTAGGGAVLAGAVLTAGDAVRRELFGGE
ncbi:MULTISPECIES: ROK family transcriptional regulator [Kitasatospora]|uniref:Putative NagC family transcriptional regulator n=1 Tax=Kitasatospora setae (strain ATCC 33774 / DSM 43861 / JCM 3304 / KCC A-0304 / NBRC 14216 / KM-6054) TaxID=452652 RepID=E4NJ73_KITSK|nr:MULTISPECIES: ROK family transcriptional regulator [Kitasatospora]BAJ33021.1 putative NagC family transcriptional regulator [Kitasatospora setae KM-6054]